MGAHLHGHAKAELVEDALYAAASILRCYHRKIHGYGLRQLISVVVEVLAVVFRIVRVVRDHDRIAGYLITALGYHADIMFKLTKRLLFCERRVKVFVRERFHDRVLETEYFIKVIRCRSPEIYKHRIALAIHNFVSER